MRIRAFSSSMVILPSGPRASGPAVKVFRRPGARARPGCVAACLSYEIRTEAWRSLEDQPEDITDLLCEPAEPASLPPVLQGQFLAGGEILPEHGLQALPEIAIEH